MGWAIGIEEIAKEVRDAHAEMTSGDPFALAMSDQLGAMLTDGAIGVNFRDPESAAAIMLAIYSIVNTIALFTEALGDPESGSPELQHVYRSLSEIGVCEHGMELIMTKVLLLQIANRGAEVVLGA